MAIRSILPILISAGFLIFAHGLTGLLIPVRGQMDGFSPTSIGAIATGYAFGFTAGCFIIPLMVRKVGHIRCFGALSAILCVSILICSFFVHPLFWFILRSGAGLATAGTFMVMESWLNERTPNAQRGSVFAIYMIVTQLALFGGQFALTADDPAGSNLFIFGAIFFALAVLPTALTGVQSPPAISKVTIDLRKLYDNSQVAVVGSFMAGMIAGAWTSFAPVFGSQAGFSTTTIATMMAIAIAGGIVFQYPIGRFSDRMDRRWVMAFCGFVGAGSGMALYALAASGLTQQTVFFVVIFIFGSVLFTIYSLFVAHANDYAEPGDFVMTSSGLLVVYGVGTMIGPLAAAAILEVTGGGGVFAVTSIGHISIALFALYRMSRRGAPEDLERTDFQTIGLARTNTPQTYEFDPRAEDESAS